MAVTRTTIRAAFPESVSASDAIVDAKIAEAQLIVSPLVYPADKLDMAVSYNTVRLLALTPFGRAAKLSSNDGKTEYDSMVDRMMRAAAIGTRVT